MTARSLYQYNESVKELKRNEYFDFMNNFISYSLAVFTAPNHRFQVHASNTSAS